MQNSTKMLEGLKIAVKQTTLGVERPELILVIATKGVTNGDNDWECFTGSEALINGCKRLSFDDSYNATTR